jgi:hypothetical protein
MAANQFAFGESTAVSICRTPQPRSQLFDPRSMSADQSRKKGELAGIEGIYEPRPFATSHIFSYCGEQRPQVRSCWNFVCDVALFDSGSN